MSRRIIRERIWEKEREEEVRQQCLWYKEDSSDWKNLMDKKRIAEGFCWQALHGWERLGMAGHCRICPARGSNDPPDLCPIHALAWPGLTEPSPVMYLTRLPGPDELPRDAWIRGGGKREREPWLSQPEPTSSAIRTYAL